MEKRPSKRTARPAHTCKDEVALIADYLAGALKPRVLAAFERHVSQCPDCMAFLKTYKKTIEATRSFMRMNSLKNGPLSLRLSPRAGGTVATSLLWLHLFASNNALTLQ
jgi:anti-sigma factor RsiW